MSSPCPRRKRTRLSTPRPPRTRNCGSLPRSLRPNPVSRSVSTSRRFFTKATKKAALNSQPGFVQEGDPAGWNKPPPRASDPMLDQTTGRSAMPPKYPHRQEAQSNRPVFLLQDQIEGRLTWVWSWSNARKPDALFPPASRPIARAFGAARCFSRAPVARSATPITPGSHRKPGSTSRAPRRGVAARAPWPDRPHSHRFVMGDAMAHMQISTETSIWLLQAKDFLVEARRLKPGPARNELRQVAKVLRELAKLEAQSESALDFGRPERT